MGRITQPRFFVFLSFVFLLEHIRLVEKYSEEVNSALEKLGKEDGWRSWRKEESLRLSVPGLLKDQHCYHNYPHLHLSHPYLHSQVDQVGSGKDFKDAESSKL